MRGSSWAAVIGSAGAAAGSGWDGKLRLVKSGVPPVRTRRSWLEFKGE